MKLEGVVVTGIFSPGSKSEHNAVYLDSGGKKYRLKRRGGNPFHDDYLFQFIGKKVLVEGELSGYFFIVSEMNCETE